MRACRLPWLGNTVLGRGCPGPRLVATSIPARGRVVSPQARTHGGPLCCTLRLLGPLPRLWRRYSAKGLKRIGLVPSNFIKEEPAPARYTNAQSPDPSPTRGSSNFSQAHHGGADADADADADGNRTPLPTRRDLSGRAIAPYPNPNVFRMTNGTSVSPGVASPDMSPGSRRKKWASNAMPVDELNTTLRLNSTGGGARALAPATVQSLPYATTTAAKLAAIPNTPTAKSGRQFVPPKVARDAGIRARIAAVVQQYPELAGEFRRCGGKKAYGARNEPFEKYTVLGESVTIVKKGAAVLARDGNAWSDLVKYFRRFARRHRLARAEPPAEPEVRVGEAPAPAAGAGSPEQKAEDTRQHQLEYMLVRPQYRKTAATPKLRGTPSMVAVDLDTEIAAAITAAQGAGGYRLDMDHEYRPEESTIPRFRTRMINGEVVLFSWRQGRLQVQDGSSWVSLHEYLGNQQQRLVRRSTLNKEWSTRPKAYRAPQRPHPQDSPYAAAYATATASAPSPSLAATVGPRTGTVRGLATTLGSTARRTPGAPRVTYEVSALKQTHAEKLKEQQLPWRYRALQLGVDDELNKLQASACTRLLFASPPFSAGSIVRALAGRRARGVRGWAPSVPPPPPPPPPPPQPYRDTHTKTAKKTTRGLSNYLQMFRFWRCCLQETQDELASKQQELLRNMSRDAMLMNDLLSHHDA